MIEECVEGCIEESSPLTPSEACDAAFSEYSACLSTAECGEFLPCDAEWGAYEELCELPYLCVLDEGGVIPNCGVYAQCLRPDTFVSLWCEGDECVCLDDGVTEFASCAADAICAEEIDRDVLLEKLISCCGMPPIVEF